MTENHRLRILMNKLKCKIKTAKQLPTIEQVVLLSKLYGISLDVLILGE